MLSYDEIYRIVSQYEYGQYFGRSDIQLAIGKDEFRKKLLAAKKDADEVESRTIDKCETILNQSRRTFPNSGLLVEEIPENPILDSLARTGVSYALKTFKTQDELISFLDNYDEFIFHWRISRPTIEDTAPQLSQEVCENLKEQCIALPKEQKQALIVYKSRLFRNMNYLWANYPNITEQDYKNLCLQIKNNDTADDFAQEFNDNYMFFSLAFQNPKNIDFFEKCGLYDPKKKENKFPNKNNFLKFILKSMQNMESIDSIRTTEPISLYRGIYGTGFLNTISKSMMISTSSNIRTAIDFADQRTGTAYVNRLTGSKSVCKITLHKQTPIIPLFFSVKSRTRKKDCGEVSIPIEYSQLKPEDIEIFIEENENVQNEVVINQSKVNIPEEPQNKDIFIPQLAATSEIAFDHYRPGIAFTEKSAYGYYEYNIGPRERTVTGPVPKD